MKTPNTSKYPKQSSEMTLQQIAETMNITRERVRQIEAKALRHIRKNLMRQGMTKNPLT